MSQSRKWAESHIAAAYMLVAGLGLAAAGAWFAYDHANFLSNTARASGTVISLKKVRGVKGTPLYYPMVRYQLEEGMELITFQAKPGLWPSPFDVGDNVTVAYAPDHPAGAKVVSFWPLWFLPAGMILLGGASMFAGQATLKKRRRGPAWPLAAPDELAQTSH